MINVCKLKKSNTSERIVPEFDNEDKIRYFILYTIELCVALSGQVTLCYGQGFSPSVIAGFTRVAGTLTGCTIMH
jgi:hypothetical protein